MTRVVRAAASGRVNLIGEHTDYNGGFVLPTAIPQQTQVELTRRSDTTAHVRSANTAAADPYTVGDEHPRGDWLDYVQGCTSVLAEAGHRLQGFEACIVSDVPLGSGLSSSATKLVRLIPSAALTCDWVSPGLCSITVSTEYCAGRISAAATTRPAIPDGSPPAAGCLAGRRSL